MENIFTVGNAQETAKRICGASKDFSEEFFSNNKKIGGMIEFQKQSDALCGQMLSTTQKLADIFSEICRCIGAEKLNSQDREKMDMKTGELLRGLNDPPKNKEAFEYFVSRSSPEMRKSEYYAGGVQIFSQISGVLLGLAKKEREIRAASSAERIETAALYNSACLCAKTLSGPIKQKIASMSEDINEAVRERDAKLSGEIDGFLQKEVIIPEADKRGRLLIGNIAFTVEAEESVKNRIEGWFGERGLSDGYYCLLPVFSTDSDYQSVFAAKDIPAEAIQSFIDRHLYWAPPGMLKTVIVSEKEYVSEWGEPWSEAVNCGIISCCDKFPQAEIGKRMYSEPVPDDKAVLLILYMSNGLYSDEDLALIKKVVSEGASHGIYAFIIDGEAEGANAFSDELKELCAAAPDTEGFMFYSGDRNENKKLLADYLSLIKTNHLLGWHTLNSDDGADVPAALFGTLNESGEFPEAVCVGKEYTVFSGYDFDKFASETYIRQTMKLTGSVSNMIINCTEETASVAQSYLHGVIWGFLSAVPVSKLNITVFDAKRRGAGIAPFLELSKKLPALFDGKIHTDPDDIRSRITRFDDQLSDLVQGRLGNQYENMISYNNAHKERSEPLQLLIVNDFPGGFDDERSNKLLEIFKDGAKCGIYVFISNNSDVKPVYSYSSTENIMSQLESSAGVLITAEKDGIYADGNKLDINLAPPLNDKEAADFFELYSERTKSVQRMGIGCERILDSELFGRSSKYSLDIPVGIGDDGNTVSVSFGNGSSHHALVAGGTGSGKSTLLHTLIMSSMLHYSPDELNLYLMDFKNGTEFKIYESVRLPHIRLLALEAMQEFGESILEELVTEMTRRADTFKSESVSSIKDYVDKTGNVMPRILIIMDEFQILFNTSENSRIANHCAELAKRIVMEGRSFGVHLLMATQSTHIIRELSIAQGTIDQMFIRIGMKFVEDDANYLFTSEKASKAMNMMAGPIGTAVMTEQYVESELTGLRIAYFDNDTQREMLGKISEKFASKEGSVKVFEAGRTVKLLDALRDAGKTAEDDMIPEAVIGEPIKVAPPLKLSFTKRGVHNVLICSAGTKDALRMSCNIFDLIAFGVLRSGNSSVYCIDGDVLLDAEGSEDRLIYEQFGRCPGSFRLAQTEADIIGFVKEIHAEFKQRKRMKTDSSVFIMIKGLEEIDIIKKMMLNEEIDESDYIDMTEESPQEFPETTDISAIFDEAVFGYGSSSGSGGNVSSQFLELIREGTRYGIHIIISCAEYRCVRENMFYGENILNRFSERFAFSMNNDDAADLIEGVSVASLKSNMVCYTDMVSLNCQVKPYVFPAGEELKIYIDNGGNT